MPNVVNSELVRELPGPSFRDRLLGDIYAGEEGFAVVITRRIGRHGSKYETTLLPGHRFRLSFWERLAASFHAVKVSTGRTSINIQQEIRPRDWETKLAVSLTVWYAVDDPALVAGLIEPTRRLESRIIGHLTTALENLDHD